MSNETRIAIVTGGASGMGKATSLRFARDGRAVGVLDIDDAGAKAVAAEIVAAGGKAVALGCQGITVNSVSPGFIDGDLDDHPDSPWHDTLVLWERTAGAVMNTNFILGDIDYADDVIPFGDADRQA